ncbi:fumarylacetoacetate hydrolase family protein [Ruixingdingia sedimenti]|uniref:Fumarylacetoacetate hydrolase family protein n=1 Tax=Ruixingdingia sedimenti TaxID=3073604 RepID=A0ABU1F4V9_9RHOB|nr:fumarylacetoacetate hydrolase family protein [Xinfangfangia sp. LG-4]MDR5651497.1 fumarylacetoacetate hydrolase family protein [Xinfangfangia sp. LG-4]
MKIASYVKDGKPTFGLLTEAGLVTLGGLVPGVDSLRAALAADALPRLAALSQGAAPDAQLADVTLLPPVPDPRRIWGMGLNYAAHAAETGREVTREAPVLFFRDAATVVAHGRPVLRPKVSTHYDFEGELAVIIGKGGRHIPVDRAMDHVAGYACFMDGSVRDYQKRSLPTGKNFESSGAFGPVMVTADEVPDPARLHLTTTLNGAVVQQAGLEQLIHTIPDLIAYFSTILSFEPGDVIATGTPAGVGAARTPPLWLKAGDVVQVEIPGVGQLENRVEDEG